MESHTKNFEEIYSARKYMVILKIQGNNIFTRARIIKAYKISENSK